MHLFDLEIFEEKIQGITEISKLDDGGQKFVFKAKHIKHGNIVLKIVPDGASDERVKREIEVVTECRVGNVPCIYEWGYIQVDDGKELLYIVEEYIEGTTLRKYLNSSGRLLLKDGLRLLEALLTIAVELEKRGVVHRDIKPENIVIRVDGGFSLLDFGIARVLNKPSLTMTKAHFGPHSPGYAAPEQLRNMKNEIDIRADLFSIGVTIYEAITGKHPFLKGTEHYLEMIKLTETVTPLKCVIPGDTQRQLIGFITIMMDKFLSRRPQNAAIALDWFKALLPTINAEED